MPTRRDIIMTSLMTGFTLAVTRAEADAIHTDSQGLVAGEIQVKTPNGTIPAYRAQPDRPGTFPILLVIEEIFGVHEYIKDVCRRLAKLGVEAGFMTKDLAILIGPDQPWLNTQNFLARIDENLKVAMA